MKSTIKSTDEFNQPIKSTTQSNQSYQTTIQLLLSLSKREQPDLKTLYVLFFRGSRAYIRQRYYSSSRALALVRVIIARRQLVTLPPPPPSLPPSLPIHLSNRLPPPLLVRAGASLAFTTHINTTHVRTDGASPLRDSSLQWQPIQTDPDISARVPVVFDDFPSSRAGVRGGGRGAEGARLTAQTSERGGPGENVAGVHQLSASVSDPAAPFHLIRPPPPPQPATLLPEQTRQPVGRSDESRRRTPCKVARTFQLLVA